MKLIGKNWKAIKLTDGYLYKRTDAEGKNYKILSIRIQCVNTVPTFRLDFKHTLSELAGRKLQTMLKLSGHSVKNFGLSTSFSVYIAIADLHKILSFVETRVEKLGVELKGDLFNFMQIRKQFYDYVTSKLKLGLYKTVAPRKYEHPRRTCSFS